MSLGDVSCAHREKRKSEWEPVSHVLRGETPLFESLCDIIAIYALQSYLTVNVVSSQYDHIWIRTPNDTKRLAIPPDNDYVLQGYSVPDDCCVLEDMDNFTLECLPYFATIEDIRREDYKYTRNWLKLLSRDWGYPPIVELNYTYYYDFDCYEPMYSDDVLFDLSIETVPKWISQTMHRDTLGIRRIYRRTSLLGLDYYH